MMITIDTFAKAINPADEFEAAFSGHHVEVYRNGGPWYTMADDISSEDIREYRVRAVLMHDDNWVHCDKCIF